MGAGLLSLQEFRLDYGTDFEAEISRLQRAVANTPLAGNASPRWLAVKLLEGDEKVLDEIANQDGGQAVVLQAREAAARLAARFGDDADALIADRRYTWINNLVRQAVARPASPTVSVSDRVDRILTSRTFGIPIFLFAMWATLKITVDVSAPFLNWVDAVINGPLTHWAQVFFGVLGLGGSWMESLVVGGVIAGVGGVLVFLPVLMSLYLVLGILEDSGYMARAAFVMDRLMNTLGLHGKSFLPMLVGFGCTVPAFFATRILENRRDRILTALLVPFMSCGARLPVYLLFAAVFFPAAGGSVVFGMYLFGIFTAVGVGLVLKNTAFKGKQASTFVMELPPFRLPSLKSIWFHVREHTGGFVRKAGGIIVIVSVLLWLSMALPVAGNGTFADTPVEQSLFAKVSSAAAPLFQPLGFGSWEASGALFSGFVAKEVVVSTLAQVYNTEAAAYAPSTGSFIEELGDIGEGFVKATVDTLKALPLIIGIDLREAQEESPQTDLMVSIGSGFERISQVQGTGHGALAGLAFMVFVLLYTPCMAAVAAERQEFGSRVMWASILGQTALAWLMAFAVFQGGLLLGLG
ncbi:MAG: ferrous iron transport protein B [Anaerolineales bacterium]